MQRIQKIDGTYYEIESVGLWGQLSKFLLSRKLFILGLAIVLVLLWIVIRFLMGVLGITDFIASLAIELMLLLGLLGACFVQGYIKLVKIKKTEWGAPKYWGRRINKVEIINVGIRNPDGTQRTITYEKPTGHVLREGWAWEIGEDGNILGFERIDGTPHNRTFPFKVIDGSFVGMTFTVSLNYYVNLGNTTGFENAGGFERIDDQIMDNIRSSVGAAVRGFKTEDALKLPTKIIEDSIFSVFHYEVPLSEKGIDVSSTRLYPIFRYAILVANLQFEPAVSDNQAKLNEAAAEEQEKRRDVSDMKNLVSSTEAIARGMASIGVSQNDDHNAATARDRMAQREGRPNVPGLDYSLRKTADSISEISSGISQMALAFVKFLEGKK